MSQRLRLLPSLGLLFAAPLLLATPACKSEEARPAPTSALPPAPPPLPEATAQQPESVQPAQAAEEEPARLFASLGCQACHRPGSAWHARLVQARDKPVEQVARFILTPRKFRPGSMMPAYDERLTEEQALSLARWIKAGNP